MRYAAARQPVPAQARRRQQIKTFAAPVRGWVINQNLARQMNETALVLDNWFPTSTGIRARGGSLKYATIANAAPVVSMWNYESGGNEQFFAATDTSIFDISSILDAETIPVPSVTGQTSGYYSTSPFSTASGQYLYAVNGADDALLYDGTTWTPINDTSAPFAITASESAGADFATSKLSHVWSFASRLFFVEKESLSAWYLPAGSVAGQALEFSLAGIFQNGGSLLFGATWSLDAGDGLDDKCVFVSDLGEIAIYEGINPSDASNWRKAGVYSITEPMGPKAIMQAGGDLLVSTEDGIVPLSEAIRKDVAALSLAAVTRAIEPEWKKQVVARRLKPWEILKWSSNNMMIVSQPITDPGQKACCFVANLETGAWCRFTGWDTNCMALYNNFGFFGTSTGEVFQMEVGGNDGGNVYTCTYVGGFDHLDTVGQYKTVLQARASFRAQTAINPQLSISTDYAVQAPAAPNSIPEFTVSKWDAGKWDEAVWDAAEAELAVSSLWQSIGESGFVIAPQVQTTFGVTPKPSAELITVDVTYAPGEVVV